MQLKVVWFSVVDIADPSPKKSGTWVQSMFNNILKYGSDAKIIASFDIRNIDYILENVADGIQYVSVPANTYDGDNLVVKSNLDFIVNKILALKPDILHVWGTESFWGLLLQDRRLSKIPKLLEIQGLKFRLCKKEIFYGGLQSSCVNSMIGLKELLFPSSRIAFLQKSFQHWANAEMSMLKSYGYINTQSDWVRNIIGRIVPNANIYSTRIILRDSFLYEDPWYRIHEKKSSPVLFTISSPLPYKGLHTLISSFKLVLDEFPDAILRVAGVNLRNTKWRNSAYLNYILKLIERNKISDHVVFLGNLDEVQLKNELYNADVFVNTSYMESYCLALAEAMSIGVPSVASYTSALPELITDSIDGYLFPLHDEFVCADRVIRLLRDEKLQHDFSQKASSKMRSRIIPSEIALSQINIYKAICADNK